MDDRNPTASERMRQTRPSPLLMRTLPAIDELYKYVNFQRERRGRDNSTTDEDRLQMGDKSFSRAEQRERKQ